MKIASMLLIGGSGQLGGALRAEFADARIIAPTSQEFDISQPGVSAWLRAKLREYKPDVVVNAAAFHNVGECEANPMRAFDVNAGAPGDMAMVCAERRIPFATISSDYVFDGTADSYAVDAECCPINVYGASKHAGERLALLSNEKTFVFRTAGLYGVRGVSSKGPHFVERVVRAGEAGEPFRAVKDVFFCPSYAPHVAYVMREIMESDAYGTHHVTSSACISWYDLAQYVQITAVHRRMIAKAQIEPISLESMHEPFRRPKCVRLLSARALPAWEWGVTLYLKQRGKRAA
jgi:dTDP-4-dehydrorhamnose reductase